MVTADSQNTLKAANHEYADRGPKTLLGRRQYLPSSDTCILHLRLLTAFALLQREVSSSTTWDLKLQDDAESERESDLQGRKWTIFVANAATRFECWLSKLVPHKYNGSEGSLATCSDAYSWMKSFEDDSAVFDWIATTPPPLDILMVLHSYILNPRDFLQDCLRNGIVQFWKSGFPWLYVNKYMDPVTFAYDPPDEYKRAYEQATGDSWNPNLSANTVITCPDCKNEISAPWSQLYSGDVSQMEKGNTEMLFKLDCDECHIQVTQTYLCVKRLEKDLKLLLDDRVPLPGTMLGNNGQVAQDIADFRSPIAFNETLSSKLDDRSKDLVIDGRLFAGDSSNPIVDLLSHLHTDDRALDDNRLAALQRQARRVDAVYHNNFSSFSLDLVGAVIRQGSFVDKMRDFAWIYSPAQKQHVSHAIERYTGFFEVMRKYPSKIAVPTFDVDLVWHTHQLSPREYYRFSTTYCGGVFIDHNDKIGDNVLTNSFEWTCAAYTEITGKVYDICLCWCCAILEAEYSSRLAEATAMPGKEKTRMKSQLKKLFSRHSNSNSSDELSAAEKAVRQVQLNNFNRDYAQKIEKQTQDGGGEKTSSKEEYFETYIWHYPQFAPSPEIACG